MAINSMIKEIDNPDEPSSELLNEIRKAFEDDVFSKYCQIDDPDSIFLQILTLFLFFLKENQIGPSVYSMYAEEEKCPVDRYGALPEFVLDPMSNKNKTLQK